jgi:hypothetical protein
MKQGYHHSQPYPHAPPVVVMDNWSQMQQQQVQTTDFYMAAATTAAAATANHVTPALNMKQKSMAAAMLRVRCQSCKLISSTYSKSVFALVGLQ